jgi:hypothetical protein
VDAKQKLEAAGMIRSETEEERKHARDIQALGAQTGKEIRQMDIVDRKGTEIGQSLDNKLDKLITLMMDEQRMRLQQQGLQPTYQPMSEEEKRKAWTEMEQKLKEQQELQDRKRAMQQPAQPEPPE